MGRKRAVYVVWRTITISYPELMKQCAEKKVHMLPHPLDDPILSTMAKEGFFRDDHLEIHSSDFALDEEQNMSMAPIYSEIRKPENNRLGPSKTIFSVPCILLVAITSKIHRQYI
jgi:hypothetical protein